MCGIFGTIGRNDAATVTFDALKELEYRGYDSWGVAAAPCDLKVKKLAVRKKTGKILDATLDTFPVCERAIGHTRWATHGGVTKKNAHPHLDAAQKIAIVHNGIIENYLKLRAQLENKDYQFISDTDSEVMAHLLADELSAGKSFIQAFRSAFQQLDGLNAVVALHRDEDCLVAARNGSPLVLGYGKDAQYISSDPAALIAHTKDVYYLEDEEIAVLNANRVEVRSLKTDKKHQVKKQLLNWSTQQVDKGSFEHFTLKEIHDQPQILDVIAEGGTAQAEEIAELIKGSYGSYLIGCGSGAYACLAGTYYFSQIARHHMNWAVGSEFGYHLDFLTKKSVVLALSQSGETMDIIESIKKAQERGATIGAFVNVRGSTVYRLADTQLLLGAGPEKAVASTKAFISKLAYLLLTAHAMNGEVEQGSKAVAKAAKVVKDIIDPKNQTGLKRISKRIATSNHLYVIGRGLSYPVALETALKIKELSYVHAEGLAAGELKHGVLALIEAGTPCLVFLPNDETYQASLAAAMEVKARGGYVIGCSAVKEAVFDEHIQMPDLGQATSIPQVVVGQLLSYYTCLARGYDPDKPRNLAKSVTVR